MLCTLLLLPTVPASAQSAYLAGPAPTPDPLRTLPLRIATPYGAEFTAAPYAALPHAPFPARLPENHSPRGALLRAVAAPGWGQLYNRQFFKIPIVYLAIGGLVGFSVYLNRTYRLHTRAYQWKGWQERVESGQAPENRVPQFEADYQRLLAEYGVSSINASQIKPLRDKYRRNRDLSRFGIGLVYGLSILDAYVSAHLLDFDVDEDLTLQVVPRITPDGTGLSARIRRTR